MKILAFLLCVLGSVLIYCSHPNQSLLKRCLPNIYRHLGILLIVLSLPLLIWQLPSLVAIYMWLMTMIVIWSFIPLLPLLNRLIPHEISKSAKDST